MHVLQFVEVAALKWNLYSFFCKLLFLLKVHFFQLLARSSGCIVLQSVLAQIKTSTSRGYWANMHSEQKSVSWRLPVVGRFNSHSLHPPCISSFSSHAALVLPSSLIPGLFESVFQGLKGLIAVYAFLFLFSFFFLFVSGGVIFRP